jgi:hypothetical protein
MKLSAQFTLLLCLLAILLAGLSASGCKTKSKVNWETRLGAYTFDQAVAELGPPDKTATLTDGRKICDWIERAKGGGGVSFGVGTGFSSGGVGVGVGQSIGSGPRDPVLRLTFNKDNVLVDWSRNR